VGSSVSRRLPRHELFGGAKKGDRTMLDALWPAARSARERCRNRTKSSARVGSCVRAAKEGAQATRHIVARRGRSSYWAIVL